MFTHSTQIFFIKKHLKMEFLAMKKIERIEKLEKNDTIAAVATALSDSGISIVRISGEHAVAVADQVFRAKKKGSCLSKAHSHTIHYGYLYDGEQMVDEVLTAVMRAPNTYTREDVVEIDCHGGVLVTRRVLETVLKHGARLAEPGEFTKRAFLNGRIDLSQAEAVMELIHSQNELAMQSSLQQVNGSMRKMIENLRKCILRDTAFIEAALDDPEHIELGGFSEQLCVHIKEEKEALRQLLATADSGRIIKEGIKTVIAGKPNVGKSSLLNLLAGQERAIVTDIAGTTRDVLEEAVLLEDGIQLLLMDTAGIRKTVDHVEKIGVDRARQAIKDADLILYVLDASRKLEREDQEIAQLTIGKPVIVLKNKMDLQEVAVWEKLEELKDAIWIDFSARDKRGFEELKDAIRNMFYQGSVELHSPVYLTNLRHKEAAQNALASLEAVSESIEAGMPEDFFSIDLMSAYAYLGTIIGEEVDEDLIDTIFKEFCMGK